MWKNYLNIAWRNLLRQRSFTLIHITGLGVGMAACLLIMRYAHYEWSYDKVSPHTPHIWRAFNETVSNGRVTTQDANTHSALGPALKTDQPEVADFFRLYNSDQGESVFFQNNEPVKFQRVWMTDPGFLRMFPQQFLEGDPNTCLSRPWHIILSRSAALRLFPGESALGKTLRIPGGALSGEYLVEAVVADPPQNTHLRFDALASYATRYAKGHEDNWSGYWDYTYFQLRPGADQEKIRRQLTIYSEQHLQREGIRLAMQPYESIRLHSNLTYEIEPNGSARTVRFMVLAALFILAIAFVNYVNMSTARALERAKEAGLRKVIGASRSQLAGQFLVEGFLLNAAGLLTAIALAEYTLPYFGQLAGRPLAQAGTSPSLWFGVAGLFAAGTAAACLYPALVLSRYTPLQVLRGGLLADRSGRGNARMRAGLVLVQFGCATILIFALAVAGRQLHFLQNHDKGLSLDQIIALKLPVSDWRQDSLNRLRVGAFKNEIARIGGIRSISASSIAPSLGIGTISGTSGGLVLARKPGEVHSGTIYNIDAEPGFYRTYGIRFLAGAPYLAPDERTGHQHVVINEAAMQLLGIASPEEAVGEEIAYAGNTEGHRMRIEGVISNVHIESLKEPARPTLYFCPPDVRNGYISMQASAKEMQPLLQALEGAWKRFFPESPFEYWFLSEQFARQYAAESRLSKIFGLFAALAVVIACLGLYGMAAYATSRRTKEIGVRKVLGASVADIAAMLSKDFLKPVMAGVLLASPFAWYFMDKWLQDFAHRIHIHWTIFALTGAVALTVAIFTVGFHSIKAAFADPVQSLKSE